jgi:hypothetical protein
MPMTSRLAEPGSWYTPLKLDGFNPRFRLSGAARAVVHPPLSEILAGHDVA